MKLSTIAAVKYWFSCYLESLDDNRLEWAILHVSSFSGRLLSFTVTIEVPFSVVKRADRSSLKPTWYAVEMESVVAHTPSLITLFLRICHLIGLAIDTGLHDMISADGTIIHVDVPSPQGHSIPLSNFKSLLRWTRFDHFLSDYFLVN